MIELTLTADDRKCRNGHTLKRSPSSVGKPRGATWCLECAKQRQKRYEKKYPERKQERQAVASSNLRAKVAGVEGRLTVSDWRGLLKKYDFRCAYCFAPYECLDHILSMSRGGKNEIENVAPACKRCNDSKESSTFVPSIASGFWPPDERLLVL